MAAESQACVTGTAQQDKGTEQWMQGTGDMDLLPVRMENTSPSSLASHIKNLFLAHVTHPSQRQRAHGHEDRSSSLTPAPLTMHSRFNVNSKTQGAQSGILIQPGRD